MGRPADPGDERFEQAVVCTDVAQVVWNLGADVDRAARLERAGTVTRNVDNNDTKSTTPNAHDYAQLELIYNSHLDSAAGASPRDEAGAVLDAVRFASGVGLIIAAVARLAVLSPGRVLCAVVVGAVGAALAKGPSQRVLPTGWWRARRGAAAAVLCRGLVSYAFVAVDVFVPLVLTEVRGYSLTFASVAVSVGVLAWSVGSWLADRFVGRVGPSRLAALGAGLVGGGVLLQTTLLVAEIPVAAGLVGVAVAALGMGVAFTPLALVVLDQQDPGRSGEAASWLSLFELLGFAFGPVLAGTLVAAAPQQPQLARSLLVAFLIAAGVAGVAVGLHQRLRLAPSVSIAATPGPGMDRLRRP